MKFPFLGASPDGIVSCQCHKPGFLEIKCPWTFRGLSIHEFKVSIPVRKLLSVFYRTKKFRVVERNILQTITKSEVGIILVRVASYNHQDYFCLLQILIYFCLVKSTHVSLILKLAGNFVNTCFINSAPGGKFCKQLRKLEVKREVICFFQFRYYLVLVRI